MVPSLSIIIVNYNGKRFLRECLNSIEQYAEFPHEVIIVDNASTDGSREYIKKDFPHVALIESAKNLGFTQGNNLGAVHAKAKLLLLLNNDTRLLSPLAPALEQFYNDEHLGVLGCRMFYQDGTFQPSFGYEHSPIRVILSWAGLAQASFLPSIFRRVDINETHYSIFQPDLYWVSGAFLMTPRILWERLGGFDEHYFMYIEDVDYCKRARMHGFRVAFTPSVEIVHYEAAGKAWIGEKALEHSMRSYVVYFHKFYERYSEFLTRLGLSVIMSMRVCMYGMVSLFLTSGTMREKRRAFSKAARILIGAESRG